MFKILNDLVVILINDRLIPADKRTRGGHNQAYKHIRANTTLDMDYQLAQDRRKLTARLEKGITHFWSTFLAVNLCFSSAR